MTCYDITCHEYFTNTKQQQQQHFQNQIFINQSIVDSLHKPSLILELARIRFQKRKKKNTKKNC